MPINTWEYILYRNQKLLIMYKNHFRTIYDILPPQNFSKKGQENSSRRKELFFNGNNWVTNK